MTADLIVTNAVVLTMDDNRPRATAVAVAGGVVLAVGDVAEVAALAGPATRIVDAKGATLLPGFVESHLHLVLGAAELSDLQLGGEGGLEHLRAAFAAHAAANPDLPLLMGQGAGYDMFGHPTTRHDLDAMLADRPIAMMAHDHHTVWANTAALTTAKLLHGADCPSGHEVVMGPDGTATGELREFQAFTPIMALGGAAHLQLGIATGGEPDPWPDAARRETDKAIIARGLVHAAAHGITSMVNMDGNRYTLSLLAELRDEGRLTARIKVPFHFKPHMDLGELDRAEAMTAEFADDWLSCGFVKMFMDGVVDSGTAFMLRDYPGRPGHRSQPLFDPERFKAICIEIDRRGLQIAVHCIGDGAVHTCLDGYQAARQANGARDARHRIEHIELIDPADVPRLAALGVTASLQPPHAPGAMDFALQPTLDILGADRWGDAYLCATLARQGARIVFASDWPVTDISVLRGIGAARTRAPYAGGGDERLGLMATLRAYTAEGAWAARLDGLTGRIEPGLAADLVLLDADLEATPETEIAGIAVAMTICGGHVTYERPAANVGPRQVGM